MNRTFIFPGQGSQTIGMGRELFENFPVARLVFEEVDDALGEKLSNLIFEGPEEELTKTYNTQPALMAVSVAVIRVLEQESGKKVNELCSLVAGHSLGQYSAMCASGSMAVGTCAKILRARGLFMQEACKEGEGAMAAIIGSTNGVLEEVLQQSRKYGTCDIANDNSRDQVVISGHMEAIDFAILSFKERNIKAIKLKVSAPFHSQLMEPASLKMRAVLEEANFVDLIVPVIDNVSLEVTTSANFLKERLLEQISGTVRWRETMDIIVSKTDSAFEIGAGRVLAGLFKKSYPEFSASNILSKADIEEFLKGL